MTISAAMAICLALAVWSALVGGVFKAFSEFIMRALARTAPACGIAAMQQINRVVLRTEFVFAIIAANWSRFLIPIHVWSSCLLNRMCLRCSNLRRDLYVR